MLNSSDSLVSEIDNVIFALFIIVMLLYLCHLMLCATPEFLVII